MYEAPSRGEGVVSEDISGRKKEKEERQTEESRIGNKARGK